MTEQNDYAAQLSSIRGELTPEETEALHAQFHMNLANRITECLVDVLGANRTEAEGVAEQILTIANEEATKKAQAVVEAYAKRKEEETEHTDES